MNCHNSKTDDVDSMEPLLWHASIVFLPDQKNEEVLLYRNLFSQYEITLQSEI